MKKLMVTGSRSWKSSELISKVFNSLAERHPPEEVTLIHGGALGVDSMAADIAGLIGWHLDVHYPDWRPNGVFNRRAGFERNEKMLALGPDLVVAFWDGKSNGTRHAFTEAITRGIPTIIYTPDGKRKSHNL